MKTLSYDCGNPVSICLRANARSAFLFTGSPRSFHSLAMTKGSKWIIPQSLTTPVARGGVVRVTSNESRVTKTPRWGVFLFSCTWFWLGFWFLDQNTRVTLQLISGSACRWCAFTPRRSIPSLFGRGCICNVTITCIWRAFVGFNMFVSTTFHTRAILNN